MPLLALSRSKTLRKLLALLFGNPQREIHLRHIGREIGMSLGAVQHQVGVLEREGWLKRRRLGNLALFSLNRDHPLYRETEAIIAKTIGIAPLLAQALARFQGVRLAFIYGSYVSVFANARFDWAADSDVDLMIVGAVDPRALSRISREIGRQTGRRINYTLLGADELKKKIASRDSFVENILSSPILPLAGFRTEIAPIRRRPGVMSELLDRAE